MTLKGLMRHVCYYFLYRNFKIYSPFYGRYELFMLEVNKPDIKCDRVLKLYIRRLK